MANFDIAIKKVSKWEGGYSEHSNDLGNWNSLGELVGTNYGISAKFYEDWYGWPPKKEEMKNMPLWKAKAIYKEYFWNKIKGDEIKNQSVANILLDGVVNHGKGVKLLQEVLNIKQDNKFGEQTLEAVNAANPKQLYLNYKERRRRYYIWLTEWRPANKVFLKGWLNRLNDHNEYSGSPSIIPTSTAAGGNTITTALMLGAVIFVGKKYFT